MKPALLYETKRGNIVERQHFGFIVAVEKQENIIYKIGDDENKKFWFRSAEKPFQASLIIKSGAYQKFNLTLRELAVCCSSHTGTDEHIKLVLSVLNKTGLSESNLKCGIHAPIDKDANEFLIRNNLRPTKLHNNCSGKHAGMLAACMANNWNIENYLDFEHPLQKSITEAVANFCNFSEKDIEIERDGCTAPVHAVPYVKMGIGYINFFLDKDYEPIKNAFQQYPFLIGGNNNLDSDIIKASSGKLISKTGAEGLCITVNLEKEQALVVKVLDANIPVRYSITMEALKQLGWL